MGKLQIYTTTGVGGGAGSAPSVKHPSTLFRNEADVGWSVPNHLTDKKAARGSEKVRNVNPSFAGMTYFDMNQQNVTNCKAKLQQGKWWRNLDAEPRRWGEVPDSFVQTVMDTIGRPLTIIAGGCAPRVASPVFVPPKPKAFSKSRPTTPTPKARPPASRAVPAAAARHQLTPRSSYLQPKEIQVMSMGVVVASQTVVRSKAAARLQHLAKQKGRGKGLGPAISEESLFVTIMSEAGFCRGEQDIVVVLDARMFRDPDAVQHERFHVGLHCDKVQDVSRNQVFQAWVDDARQQLDRCWQRLQPGGRLCVLVYCRKGAHRSVACATILHHCLQQRFRGAHVLPMHHFSKAHLWRRDYCGECEDCVASANSFKMSGAELPCDRSLSPPDHCRPTTGPDSGALPPADFRSTDRSVIQSEDPRPPASAPPLGWIGLSRRQASKAGGSAPPCPPHRSGSLHQLLPTSLSGG